MSTLVSQMFLRMSDTTPVSVEWAWDGLVPSGNLTLLTGDPGIGKSLVALQVAAMVTRGVKNPRDLIPGLTSKGAASNAASSAAAVPGGLSVSTSRGVLVLSAADQPRETVLPRLIAAGADPSQVFFLNGDVVEEPEDENDDGAFPVARPFRLSQDIEKLEWCLMELSDQGIDVGLIVIDSIDRYLGTDEKKGDRIEVVAQLAKLAAKANLAMLVTANTSMKAGSRGGTVVYQELMNTARSVLMVAPDLENPDQRLVLPIKHNLTARPPGFSFTVCDGVVQWGTEPIDLSSDEYRLLARRNEKLALVRDDVQEIERATNWLKDELALEPAPSEIVQRRASQIHLSYGTLRRAFKLLGGKVRKQKNQWFWSLPEEEVDRESSVVTGNVLVI
jgi:putative DNA primase/helicase